MMIWKFYKKTYIIGAAVHPFFKNWGDDLNLILPKLINKSTKIIIKDHITFGGNYINYVCIGSIISWEVDSKSIIWGAGVLNPKIKLAQHPKQVLAVRGPLTRNYLISQGINCPEVYGDPALLLPRFYNPKKKKIYKVGIIPHFTHKNHKWIKKISTIPGIKVIDVQKIKPWTNFIDEILSCEFILSSSLHGVIISDAYNIPNERIIFADGEKKDFPFEDYYLSVKRTGWEGVKIIGDEEIDDVIKKAHDYRGIDFDSTPLFNLCPFR